MHNKIDDLWLFLLLGSIGEQFNEGEHICGVVVSIRKSQDRLAVWTKDGHADDAVLSIG